MKKLLSLLLVLVLCVSLFACKEDGEETSSPAEDHNDNDPKNKQERGTDREV